MIDPSVLRPVALSCEGLQGSRLKVMLSKENTKSSPLPGFNRDLRTECIFDGELEKAEG